ncbi:MAG: hypothetical protein K0R60_1423 [Microbacterium sp.]|jgi:hypothetical protein|nr:hypothetical protein [Microbacterium sp.]
MGFHIGQQNAANINNVDGDQTIHGGQHGTFLADPAQALAALRAAVDATPLPPQAAASARHDLETASAALGAAEPDKAAAAGALERLTRTLKSAGALASAGAALVGPLQAIGRWLGPIGATLLGILAL